MKTFLKDFSLGLGKAFEGFGFAFKHGIAHFFLYPLIITVILAIFAAQGIRQAVDVLQDWTFNLLGLEQVAQPDGWWDTIVFWLQNIAESLIAILLYVAFYFVLHKIIKYAVLILMSPIMALVSEHTEKVLTGKSYPFNFGQFARDVWRGIRIAIRNFFVEIFLVLAIILANLLITSVFPIITIITSPLAFVLSALVSSYFWGFATMDYTNERRRLSLRESVRFIRQNKGVAVGNGLLFYILISIPVLGAYIGPVFATVMCTIGATLAIHQKVDLGVEGNYLVPESSKDSVADDQILPDGESL